MFTFRTIAEGLKAGNSIQPETFDSVSIICSDLVRFTVVASRSTPIQMVALLNQLYGDFDNIISSADSYKVIGNSNF